MVHDGNEYTTEWGQGQETTQKPSAITVLKKNAAIVFCWGEVAATVLPIPRYFFVGDE
jgi:hypothetical protein